ncbi:hypothetical protein AKJ62_00295 [candidate division MSBL1 archaeon SCGC-AAA259D14]|uniref:Electron transfer flavoprotein alpha/beta-subunit N-terminal domain-containing protein n=2 Tax=candidate division MSBL1 TaxID=215777 RepID=A0A133U8X7_9EURY|nr:hypothetical protein AKJ62_00295 [candidate division MSBL1 archaeon SCGC-AAA259D14]KXA93839.1 hypothetical protein AKJ66_00695 [candidate division MSBL1 archaeon SCGC-AAA259E22]
MDLNFVVCIKQVPASMEDIELTEDGEIDDEYLDYDINDWDNYALEAAVQLKEEFGGKVTLITVGPEEYEETIRMCFAKNADEAIRVYDEKIEGSDTYSKAKIIADVMGDLDPDLIFTGLQSTGEGHAQLGVALAELLDLPHASLVTSLDFDPETSKATVNRELEGGLEEKMEIETPAVLAIQTGINEPRYASVMGIRKARDKEIKLYSMDDLDLDESEIGGEGSLTRVEKLYEPPVGEMAEIFEGSPDETSEKLAETLDKLGLV